MSENGGMVVFQFALSKGVKITLIIRCQHAVRHSHIAVKTGSFKGCVLQTLL